MSSPACTASVKATVECTCTGTAGTNTCATNQVCKTDGSCIDVCKISATSRLQNDCQCTASETPSAESAYVSCFAGYYCEDSGVCVCPAGIVSKDCKCANTDATACAIGNLCDGSKCYSACTTDTTLTADCACINDSNAEKCDAGQVCDSSTHKCICPMDASLTATCTCGTNSCYAGQSCYLDNQTKRCSCPVDESFSLLNQCGCGSTTCDQGQRCKESTCQCIEANSTCTNDNDCQDTNRMLCNDGKCYMKLDLNTENTSSCTFAYRDESSSTVVTVAPGKYIYDDLSVHDKPLCQSLQNNCSCKALSGEFIDCSADNDELCLSDSIYANDMKCVKACEYADTAVTEACACRIRNQRFFTNVLAQKGMYCSNVDGTYMLLTDCIEGQILSPSQYRRCFMPDKSVCQYGQTVNNGECIDVPLCSAEGSVEAATHKVLKACTTSSSSYYYYPGDFYTSDQDTPGCRVDEPMMPMMQICTCNEQNCKMSDGEKVCQSSLTEGESCKLVCVKSTKVTEDCLCQNGNNFTTVTKGNACNTVCEINQLLSSDGYCRDAPNCTISVRATEACLCHNSEGGADACERNQVCKADGTCIDVCSLDTSNALKGDCQCTASETPSAESTYIPCFQGYTCDSGICVCPTGAVSQSCKCSKTDDNDCIIGSLCDSSKCFAACTADTTLTATCGCGNEKCEAGQMCDSASNTCVCPMDAALTVSCSCGTETCAIGQSCYTDNTTKRCSCPVNGDVSLLDSCGCASETCKIGQKCKESACKCMELDTTCTTDTDCPDATKMLCIEQKCYMKMELGTQNTSTCTYGYRDESSKKAVTVAPNKYLYDDLVVRDYDQCQSHASDCECKSLAGEYVECLSADQKSCVGNLLMKEDMQCVKACEYADTAVTEACACRIKNQRFFTNVLAQKGMYCSNVDSTYMLLTDCYEGQILSPMSMLRCYLADKKTVCQYGQMVSGGACVDIPSCSEAGSIDTVTGKVLKACISGQSILNIGDIYYNSGELAGCRTDESMAPMMQHCTCNEQDCYMADGEKVCQSSLTEGENCKLVCGKSANVTEACLCQNGDKFITTAKGAVCEPTCKSTQYLNSDGYCRNSPVCEGERSYFDATTQVCKTCSDIKTYFNGTGCVSCESGCQECAVDGKCTKCSSSMKKKDGKKCITNSGKVGGIVGGIIAAVIVIAAIVVAVICVQKNKSKVSNSEKNGQNAENGENMENADEKGNEQVAQV